MSEKAYNIKFEGTKSKKWRRRILERMSGAQGAQPKESKTATTYESIEGGQNRTRTDLLSKEDQGGIQVDKLQEKVHDPAGKGGPVFGAGRDEDKKDLGVTGTG